jgi:hypothetical protein
MTTPMDEEEFTLLNHMLDDTLDGYRHHHIHTYTPAEQAQLVYMNKGLRLMDHDDLISLIAVMAVRLFATEPAPPTDP